MQSLPIPVTQTKALNLADVASKNGSPANKSSAENAKATFQAELNKQVKAKQTQTQAKQDKNTESAKSPAQQTTATKDSSEVDQAAQASKDSNNTPVDASFLADLNKQLDAARDMANQGNLSDAKPTAVPAGAENKEAIVNELISSLGISPVQNVANNEQVSVTAETSSAVLTSTDAALQQKNLMAAFNNAATSSQSQVQQPAADISAKPQGEGLADVLAAKPDMKSATEDASFGKAIANAAKDLPAKDLLVKDVVPNTVQVQAASTNAVQNNNNVAAQQLASSNVINVYPGKTGWDQAISQKVVWMVGAGQQSASLTLNPPDLGPLKVVISVHNDQADTTFISDNDEVRKALESGMSNLRDKMSESGIQLGQANVSTSQQSQQEFQQAAQGRVFDGAKNQTQTKTVESDSHAKVSVRVSDGLVDTFA